MNRTKKSGTLTIIIINITCFILTLGGSKFSIYLGNNYDLTVREFQIWRLLTSMFFHFGLMHILCNMYSLINIGSAVESQYGTKKFYAVYFITGIIGGLIACVLHNMFHHAVLSAGASGAICGLLGFLIGDMKNSFSDKIKIILNSCWPIILIGLLGSGIDNLCHFSCLGVGLLMGSLNRK